MSSSNTSLSPFRGARDLITQQEAAERLKCHRRTVRRYIGAGLLTGYRIGPRSIRVDAAEVDALGTRIPSSAASS